MKRNYEIAVISKGAFARTIRIYSPKKAKRALIVHDGCRMFDNVKIIDILKASGAKDTAVIGIDSSVLGLDCYLPFKPETEIGNIPDFEVQAQAYREYICDMLIPYLDKRFGFSHYAMLGEVAAAAFTLFYASTGDQRVTEYYIFDAALYLCPNAFTQFLNTAAFDKNADYKIVGIYSNKSGTSESAIDIAAALQKNNVKSIKLDIKGDADIAEFIKKSIAHKHV